MANITMHEWRTDEDVEAEVLGEPKLIVLTTIDGEYVDSWFEIPVRVNGDETAALYHEQDLRWESVDG